jgi:hypothetical protein
MDHHAAMDSQLIHSPSTDGIRLSAWINAAPVSRATAYELLRVLGIVPSKARVAGSRSDVAFLSEDQAARMDAAAARMAGGARLSDLAAALSPVAHVEPSVEGLQTVPGPERLLAKLEAIERACRTGAPLTTDQVGWMLGARPGAAVVVRGRITATRHSRNVWSLSTDSLI